MHRLKSILYPLAAFLLLASCQASRKNLNTLYTHAIEDAMYPDSQKIDYNLVRLTPSDPNTRWKKINGEDHVLVVTWTSYGYPSPGLNTPYNSGNYYTWVTAVPQLQRTMKQSTTKNRGLRLEQLLGMPPQTPAPDSTFVEFWVRPADLFRPCPDKDIAAKSCPLCFPTTPAPDSTHIRWINTKRLANYNCNGLYGDYPWTDLGYTYDWSPKNKTHRGLSEFVIDTFSNIYINRVVPTDAYLDEPVRP